MYMFICYPSLAMGFVFQVLSWVNLKVAREQSLPLCPECANHESSGTTMQPDPRGMFARNNARVCNYQLTDKHLFEGAQYVACINSSLLYFLFCVAEFDRFLTNQFTV